MATRDGFIAVTRFGLGARPGELDAASADPRGWLDRQIALAPFVPNEFAGLPTSAAQVKRISDARQNFRRSSDKKAARDALNALRKSFRKEFRAEVNARTHAAVATDVPFRERLVHFWSNHFTVSATKPMIAGVVGAYEREAIRPHVTGRFADMLKAVVRHPAMLLYLDNAQSIGPNSRVGRRRKRGLNENLAREILELHSLGVEGGYTQADVIELAKILTGWTMVRPAGRNRLSSDGRFVFLAPIHEPGAKTLLGTRIPESGEQEGVQALELLARHPSTARFVATKLVRHFVSDDPPADAVRKIAEVFRETDGDLAAVARAMVRLDAVWTEPLPKIRTPNDLVIAAYRAAGTDAMKGKLAAGLHVLGQTPFSAPSPAGWKDTAAAWMSPEALMGRIDWLNAYAARSAGATDALAVADGTVGPLVPPSTRQAITRAPSNRDALALLFASPEFQRR